MAQWQPIETAPEGRAVLTKIDNETDEHGPRNIQKLTRRGRLWWTDSMYVYYTPTHWLDADADALIPLVARRRWLTAEEMQERWGES